jgi:hypothetical protein
LIGECAAEQAASADGGRDSTFHRIMWWNVSPFSESLQR